MVNVTSENMQSLERLVQPYAGRGFTTVHTEAWNALAEQEQERIQTTEAALKEFRVKFEAEERARERRESRREDFAKTGCCLTDEALESMLDSKLASTDALERAEKWRTAGARPWLVLSGATGCGKSLAAASAMLHRPGKWVRADELVRLFWANFGDQYEKQEAVRAAGLLVVDDVGCELDAARMLAAFLDLLDTRKSRKATPTIITTNLSKAAFAERYKNERLISRMAESAEWAAVGGDDLRRKANGR